MRVHQKTTGLLYQMLTRFVTFYECRDFGVPLSVYVWKHFHKCDFCGRNTCV